MAIIFRDGNLRVLPLSRQPFRDGFTLEDIAKYGIPVDMPFEVKPKEKDPEVTFGSEEK